MPDAIPAPDAAPLSGSPPPTSPGQVADGTGAGTAAPPATPQATEQARPAERDSLSGRFAALHGESRRLAQEKQAWAQERAEKERALQAKEAALAAQTADVEAWKAAKRDIASDPERYVKALWGEDYYDKLTAYRLGGPRPEVQPEAILRNFQEETRSRLTEMEKREQERWAKVDQDRKAAIEAERAALLEENRGVIRHFEESVTDWVRANADKFELIAINQAHHLVPAVIQATYEQTSEKDPGTGRVVRAGRILSQEEAAQQVEDYLFNLLEKNYGSKRWQSRAVKPPAEEPSRAASTITNTMGGVNGVAPRNGMPLDLESDRMKRFNEAWEAELRKASGR